MILKLLTSLLSVSIIFSCNTQSIRQARLNTKVLPQAQNAQVDSFLYYQPIALNNNFLDSLKIQNDKQIYLKVRVFPPLPPPPPKFREVEGFRVQIFAGLDSINALIMMAEVKRFFVDSVYLFKENDLHKIQIGDFLYRNDADTKVYDLRKNNISSGWVVQRMINIPVDTMAVVDSLKTKSIEEKEKQFTIQILVTSDPQKAKTTVDQLKNKFKVEASITQTENLYKIFLGAFETRDETEKTLQLVRENGYKDAWIVRK